MPSPREFLPALKALHLVRFGRPFGKLEMPAIGRATDLHERPALAFDPAGDKTHDEPDPLVNGTVRIRAVNDVAMVQRHFAGTKLDIDGRALVDLRSDPFTSPQEVMVILKLLVLRAGRLRENPLSHACSPSERRSYSARSTRICSA